MALRCTASASKRPEEVRKPQQGLAARFKLCGRKPLRGLPPSPRWTWRCALRGANVRKGLGGYTRSSGAYLGPSGCVNAPRGFVLRSTALPQLTLSTPLPLIGRNCSVVKDESWRQIVSVRGLPPTRGSAGDAGRGRPAWLSAVQPPRRAVGR